MTRLFAVRGSLISRARTHARMQLSGAALTCALVLAVGCGDSSKENEPGEDQSHDPSSVAGGKADAGKRDGGSDGSVKRDGSAPTGMTDPGGDPGDVTAPKQLVQVDECGDDNSAGLSADDVDKLLSSPGFASALKAVGRR